MAEYHHTGTRNLVSDISCVTQGIMRYAEYHKLGALNWVPCSSALHWVPCAADYAPCTGCHAPGALRWVLCIGCPALGTMLWVHGCPTLHSINEDTHTTLIILPI